MPGKRATVADVHRELSAAELADEVERTAGAVAALGIGPGDVVATMLPNRIELVAAMFAAWRLGAALTPVNPALTADEAHYQLRNSGAKLAIVDSDTAPRLAGNSARLVHVDELASAGGPAPEHESDDAETALLIYTSGTTGRPKGVVLDHANVRAMVAALCRHLELGPQDRALLVMPLFHVNGLVASVLCPLAAGGSTVILDRFSRTEFWDEVERWRPTYFSMVPAMYVLLNALPDDARPDTTSLRFCVCGAAPAPPEALPAFTERYATPVIEGYGLSETTVACAVNPLHGVQKPGSVGPALEGSEIRIDSSDTDAGEVLVRGPNVMRGYLGLPEATAEVLRDGWLHTGDVGRLDDDGYLYIVGRVKDMIIRGGENIYPIEIEHLLAQHPAIAEAAVVGKPDPVMGEMPVAFVVPTAGEQVDTGDVLGFAGKRLAKYKVPGELRVLDELPRNPVGKIDKAAIRELV